MSIEIAMTGVARQRKGHSVADISPVGAVGGAAAPDPTQDTSNATLQDAFAQGVVSFMGIMLQGVQSDIIDSINDTTSTPDAPN